LSILRISRIAMGGVVQRLANPDTGFNPRLVTAMSDAGLSAPNGFKLPISFAANSRNFYQADVAPPDFIRTTAYTLPMMTLFSVSSTNKRLEKFATFAGTVELRMNIWFSWSASRALQDMESIGHCFEEAIIGSFNDEPIADWSLQYDSRLVYDGDVWMRRSAIERDEESWSQQLQVGMLMDVQAHSGY
jgi:hypothetical protein